MTLPERAAPSSRYTATPELSGPRSLISISMGEKISPSRGRSSGFLR